MSITKHRDLRTGESLWLAKRRQPLAVSPLTRRHKCDVLVVGSGISGAIIAESLSDAGYNVTIVDRRGPVIGSTPASTAMLQYEIDTPLFQLAERIGRDKAERLWRRSKLAVDALRERSERLGIKADQATRGSLYLDGNVLDADGLAKEYEARVRAGFEVALLKPAEVKATYGISGRHAIAGFGNYSANPRRLAAGFLNAAIGRGAQIYAPVDVTDIDATETGVRVATQDGPEIECDALVFATGYEMPKGVPKMGNSIISSWSIATAPQKRLWPTEAIIWEASDPYLYIRTTGAGEVICGGEDEEIDNADERDAKIADKTATLSRKLGALLPMIDSTPAFAWAGSFGDSTTGTPTVGRVPRMPNCYAAMGYGGNGITFSMMAGQMLRTMISGGTDPDAELVSFYREF